jgi:S-DNA-T family DNA segregation ATPase FtsK/SpoIIIE
LEEVLNQFKIKAQVINTEIGPVITRYELKMPPSVLVSRVASLGDTIAYNLAAKKVRVVAPIPGKAAVGVEIPNTERTLVTLGDLFLKKDIKSAKVLDFYLGLDVTGKPIVPNLKDAPHLIIAGATGQGKSVCINSILISFLYTCTPEDLRLILVDPKMVELKMFNGIEHLLTEVITDKRKSITALKWLVGEMERRYSLMEQASVRDIARYNEKMAKSSDPNAEHFPYIVLVVDELNDLMVVNKKETEDLIVRLSQKARAAGIHLILATQRPSVDVITGVIKANFPSRIAFLTQSRIDSRTILDQGGAEQLLGKGDMLLSYTGSNELIRLQGAYLSEEEVMNVVNYLKSEAAPEYIDMEVEEEGRSMEEGDVEKDEMYQQAIEIIRTTKKASASFLQRRLQIGYNRAARYIDLMEKEGIIGPQNGSKPREVHI